MDEEDSFIIQWRVAVVADALANSGAKASTAKPLT